MVSHRNTQACFHCITTGHYVVKNRFCRTLLTLASWGSSWCLEGWLCSSRHWVCLWKNRNSELFDAFDWLFFFFKPTIYQSAVNCEQIVPVDFRGVMWLNQPNILDSLTSLFVQQPSQVSEYARSQNSRGDSYVTSCVRWMKARPRSARIDHHWPSDKVLTMCRKESRRPLISYCPSLPVGGMGLLLMVEPRLCSWNNNNNTHSPVRYSNSWGGKRWFSRTTSVC